MQVRHEHRAFVHPRTGKDLRVDEHEGHRGEQRRDAGAKSRAHVAAALAQAEIAIEKRSLAHSLCCIGHVTSQPLDRSVTRFASAKPDKAGSKLHQISQEAAATPAKASGIGDLSTGVRSPARSA